MEGNPKEALRTLENFIFIGPSADIEAQARQEIEKIKTNMEYNQHIDLNIFSFGSFVFSLHFNTKEPKLKMPVM